MRASRNNGDVYVVERDGIYKIGFSRAQVRRRVRDIGGNLVLTIPAGDQPASLERAIHLKFTDKRTNGPLFKREWFALDDDDLDWLRGLVEHMRDHKMVDTSKQRRIDRNT